MGNSSQLCPRLQLLIDSLPCFTTLFQGYLPLQMKTVDLNPKWQCDGVGWGEWPNAISLKNKLVLFIDFSNMQPFSTVNHAV
jgi:hypothetical protein